MAGATPNMPADEWPELEAQDLQQIGELLRDHQYMQDHQDDGPLPGSEK